MRAWMAVAAVAAMVVSATPATADWQWTRWGMTEAEVVAASGGRAVPHDGGNQWLLRIHGPYKVGTTNFDNVSFRFTAGGLSAISMMAGADDFESLERQITASVGAPVGAGGGRTAFRTWIDREKGNSIELQVISDAVFLEYTPVTKAEF